MKLESIVETYGKRADYYDMHTGYTYALTMISEPDENGDQKVPVYENGSLIGFATVNMRNW